MWYIEHTPQERDHMWTHHPLPDLAYILLGGLWVFLMFMACMVFFDQLAKELRRD